MNNTLNFNLHYVYDPLCGWCYAIAPLIEAIQEIPGLRINLHGGGLWTGSKRQQMGPEILAYVKPHDNRIAELSGQKFSDKYFNELLLDSSVTIDSEPPIRAVIAIENLGGDNLTAMHRIQELHYKEGLWTGNINLLAAVAQEQGINESEFLTVYKSVNFKEHTQKSNLLKEQLQGQGYPTLGLEKSGKYIRLDTSSYIGKPDAFKSYILTLI